MNFAQPLETGPANVSFKKDIEDWSAIAPNLFIWNYVTNFSNYLLPQPNYRGLAPDIRFFVNHNAIGLFEQGDAGCWLGDFVRPRQWVIAHLQWNPFQDEMALVNKFFDGYYGAAGQPLLKYINFLCDAVEKAQYNLRCYNANVYGWLTPKQVLEAVKLYAVAEEAVKDDPILAKRVRRERLPLDLVQIMYAQEMSRTKRFLGKDADLDLNNIVKLADEFVELTKDAGQWREGRPFGDYAVNLQKSVHALVGASTYVPEICKGKALDAWDVFPVISFNLHGEGRWVKAVNDPAAAQGKVLRMPGNHKEWAAQTNAIPINYYDTEKQWKLVVTVRCDAAAKDGHRVLPLGESVRDHKGSSVLPVLISAVAVSGKHIVITGDHEVSFFLHFLRRLRELIPIRDLFLDSIRIIRAEHLLGDRPAIDKYTGRRLPGHRLQNAHIGARHLLRIGELVLQLFVCKTNLFLDIQRVVTVYINCEILLRREI